MRIYKGFEIYRVKNGYFITLLKTSKTGRCDTFGPFQKLKEAKEKIDHLAKIPYYKNENRE